MVSRRTAHDVEHLKDGHTTADELGKSARKSRHANLVHERPENWQFEFPAIGQYLAPFGAHKGAHPKDCSANYQNEEIPVSTDKITEVDKELRRSGQLRAEILENFTENRNDADDQECGDGKCDTEYDDGVSHR